ncbi:hypothetical protein NL676_027609 [Syzygium grande]|nr:hypothetical protein NL676_027609 [Syzygium grande]
MGQLKLVRCEEGSQSFAYFVLSLPVNLHRTRRFPQKLAASSSFYTKKKKRRIPSAGESSLHVKRIDPASHDVDNVGL